MAGVDAYGVRGLMCTRCLVAAIEELRALPGVEEVGVDLVPFGESRITVGPAAAATTESVRAMLAQAGFVLVGRRRYRPRAGLDDAAAPSLLAAS